MSISLGAIDLPDRLYWTDRYSWAPVVQSFRRTEAGILVREESPVVKGRPITLVGSETYAWSERSVVDSLEATQQAANAAPMTLTIHGEAHQVVWRFDGGQPMVVRPLYGPVSNPAADEPFVLAELRFITV